MRKEFKLFYHGFFLDSLDKEYVDGLSPAEMMELESIIEEESDYLLVISEELYKVQKGEMSIGDSKIANALNELIENGEIIFD